MLTKKELRTYIKEEKQKLTSSEKAEAGNNVLDILKSTPEVISTENIVAYWSMPDELPTQKIIEFLSANHKIYLPVITGDQIIFHRFEGNDHLEKEKLYGILEPKSQETLPENAPSVVLVPGIAFSPDGQRLGRGGGYYDKILAKLKNTYKIGIAYKCQIVDEIPSEPHDMKMDKVIFG